VPSEGEIYAVLTEIFREVFLCDDLVLTSQLTAQDVPDWDSHRHIEILLAVEERYGIRFSSKELDSLTSVGDLARTVLVKTGG
jgi:acyl carrier protein